MSAGRFISLEGGEGVGKSTQLRALADALRDRGQQVLTTREPGGSPGAEAIRELLLGGAGDRWSMRAEALLFAAARADHVERLIRPALAAGQWVLSDRFLDSSLAYQGDAGGLGIAEVRALHRFGSEGFLPDRTLVLIAPDGAQRARQRDGGVDDRIGGRSAAYHQAVEDAFQRLGHEDPARVRLVDATGSPGQVTERLIREVEDLL